MWQKMFERQIAGAPRCGLLVSAIMACGLALSPLSQTLADDVDECFSQTFAPLDYTIPACDLLIGSAGLDDATLFAALMSRAEAWSWAVAYKSDHDISDAELLTEQLADLELAVSLARRLSAEMNFADELHRAISERAAALLRSGDNVRAIEDYSEAIGRSEYFDLSSYLGRSLAFEALGAPQFAIADMTTIIELTIGQGNHANWLVRRAELHEANGDPQAAILDYRSALVFVPGNPTAIDSLQRLGAAQ
jgi:tetratricopeptide (TPR) repeat protein